MIILSFRRLKFLIIVYQTPFLKLNRGINILSLFTNFHKVTDIHLGTAGTAVIKISTIFKDNIRYL